MPKFQVTSPSGSSYEVMVPEGDENLPDFQERLKRQVTAYEQTYAQSGASALGSGALQGLTSVVAEPIRGAGELLGSEDLTSLGEEIAGTAKYNAPISPLMEDSWYAQGGQALGQGVGQLGLALISGGTVSTLGKGLSAAAKARAVQAAVLGPAFFAGAAGGADESRRLGLEEGSAEDIANKLLYGGSELLSESIFGLGSKAFSKELVSDAPGVLLRGARTTAAGRAVKAIGQEALEEPIAGAMQDVSSRIAVEFGGQGDFLGSTTDNGAELRNPFDPKARLTEAALGAIGAGPFGVRAAMSGDGSVDEVRDYRNRVNKARKDGSIKPKDQTEIDALDTKAKDFLELEGVPLMRNLGQSAVDGTAQGAVELSAIINDPAAAPAVRAAAQVKLERFKEQGKKVVEQTDKFLAGDISLGDLRTSVSEYENLNPYSNTNQEKQLAAAEAAQAAAPVAQVAQANAAAGNTATAAALIDTQAARQRATALRAQARADRKAPVTQQQPPAPVATPTPATTAPVSTPPPPVNSREQAAREVEASYDEAVRTALPQVDNLVNESLPTLVNQVSQALADGDFETASSLAERLTREASRFQRFDAPEIQAAFSRTLTPEQQDDFKRKRTATEQLAKDVQRTVAARAKASGTPVGVAVAARMAPKPTQAEFSLDTPAQAEAMTAAEAAAAVDEFGLPVEDAPVDEAVINEAFAELETPQEAPVEAETPPASAVEPVVSELAAVDAELEANKLKRQKARERARAARGRLGFFGGDPIEQAIADGRVWKANVELGYLLLKKGYVRFKIWAREYLRQNADDPASMRLLRRIYRMLRDDPASAASLLDVPADQIESLSGGMDASINNVSLAPEPQIKDPGYFGAIENVLDWAGNTTFFEGRESVPGGGKSHRIYLDEVIEGVTYDVVYRFEGKTYRTGDRVSRHGDEWLFGYGVGAGPRASRFRMYSTTLLTASFTGNNESTSRVAEDTRRNIIAFNQIAQFDASGRLAFNRSDEVARWISSVRYEKDDFRFPVNGDISDSEITVKLAGTEDVVGRFTLRDGVWVFGSGESLTKGEQTAQDSFAVVGFELEDSKGTTSADTPAKVVAAWPAKSKTYNPLDGFGPAPVNPEGKRVKAKTSEPAFKNYADLESWISAKRMRQGHSLDINKIRRYVRERGPRSFRKYVDKAMDAANKAYDAAYPAEQTSLPVFKARDNRNIGVQYARMVQDSAGARPLFTNNVFETAVQINMGLKVFVPEGFAGAVHPLIQVNPDTREVISASDASGKVSKAGDHLAVRQRDPNVLAKSEARMATEDEMNEALLDDFDFVDGLPKAADEDTMLAEARRKFASMRFSPSATKPFDRALVDLVATANLFAGNRLALLRPVIEETGYSKDGVVLDTAKLPAAIAAARAFIEARRQQAKTQRASLQDLGESTREVEDVSVLPDRLEDLVKAAAKSMVLRNNGGPINYGAYWNRALRRVIQRYNTRIQSGFAAPVATTQYNEEGSEQIDPNDEEQQAAALAAGDVGMTGSSLRFEDVVDEADEPEGGFVNPQKTSGRPVQLDLFGKETTEEAEPDTEDTASVTEEDEPELTENNDLGVALTTEVAAEPELTEEERFQISPEVAAKRNRGQRSTMRRILRDLPVHLKNAVFNSPTTDRFDVVLTSYYAMRSALIRSGVLRSEERPTFREAMDLVFKNQDKVKGLDKLFSNSVKEALGQMSRAHAKAPGIPNARDAKAAADALGLVDGDPQSAIDALTRAASLLEIPFGTRMLLKRIAGLKGVTALRDFSMIPMETARGTMLRDRAIINISPSGSVTETAETLGHEFVHLSTEQAFQDLESGTADEAVVRADEELTAIREELASHAFRTMGAGLMVEYSQAFDNNSEFLAYLFSDSKFNAWVSSRPQSFLIRVANAIRKLLGLKVPANTTMDKAWRALLLMSDRPAMFAQTQEAVSRDALELILMSIDERGPGAEARNLMAGANARRLPEALKDSFSKARDMDAAGESKTKIRKETGWYKAPTDKQWRWEINDKDSKFDEEYWNLSSSLALRPISYLFKHDKFFEAYPEAEKVLVKIMPYTSAFRGQLVTRESGQRVIYLNEGLSPAQARKTIIHELQHWIQFEEGFFNGTNPNAVQALLDSGELTLGEAVSALAKRGVPPNLATAIYRRWPGELEATLAAYRADMTDEERAVNPIAPFYPVNALTNKLRNLAANGGVQAAYDMADTGIEVSTERDAPMWYDGSTDTIKMNPDTISADTEGLSPREVREYMKRLVLHENIHRADNHGDTIQERDEYMNAMSESDFEWIASMYYVDPAQREFALGRTPGMSADQKAEQRRLLVWEHRRAMIELALKGETTEQFAVFIASNPGLVDHIKRLLWRFVNLLTAKVRQIRYAGSVLDLQGVMETLNNIEEVAPSPNGEDVIAEARSVAVPIRSRRLGNYKVGGWATTGFLNQETAEQQRVRDAKLRAMQARVQMHKDDLARAVKKEYTSQGLANPESLINEALGSIENPVAPQQLAVAEQLRTRAVRNAVSKFLGQQNLARSQSDPAQTALIRENARSVYQSELVQARKIKERYINKVESDWVTATKAKQAAAFAALSPETSTVVRAIRDDIDAMQQQLIQSGVLGPKTAARVTKTFGIYLTRSYQVYNENIVTVSGVKRNLWNEFLRDSKDPKSVAILDAARAAIFEDAVKEKAKELKLANTRARNPIGPFQSVADRDTAIKGAQRANPVLDSAEALRRARAMLQSNGGVEVETLLEKYLEMGENMDSDTDVLKRRDAIHPAIQALWGVYEQNEYNAFNTMMKINAVIANQKLFDEIYKHGKASGYIFDKEGVVVDGQRTVPLGGTGTQANRNRFGILAGKYGPAELKAGLEEAFGGNTQFTSSWWNFIRAATGYAMATKTKYSIQGTARNFVGNIMFAGINLNVHKLFDPRARGVVARQLGLKTKNKTEYDNYIRRLIELRVVSESAYEFRDLTREFSKEALGWVNRATKGRKFLSSAVENARKLDKFAGVAHQGADDFWKVLSFEGELARVKKWEPNLTQEQAEEKAAWKIRHTMPTYTEAFYFIKRLRQQPFIAPFITFTAEVYRTTFGTVKVGLNEIAEGRANGNRGQMIAGLARISNLVAAIGFMPTLMAMLGKAAFGAGEDDEEDGINPGAGEAALRRFVPEYMRSNSLMRFGSGKWDEQIYMDASYLIPHDVLGKILRGAFDAYMKPETIGVAEKAADAGLAFMEKVLEPVTNEQLFFGSIMQAKFNYNQAYDRKIYRDTDTTWDATKAVIGHIYTSALEPGTVRTGRLIVEAADGVVRDGMKLEVANEMLSVVGIKKRTVMLETRFARNADEHKKTMGEASTHITSPLQSNSTVEDADIKRGYDRANEVRMNSLREARRDYLAATHLGMPQAKAKQLLLDSQLSDDEVALVVGNFYTPYQVSDQVFTKALEKSKAFGQDRVRLYLDAVKQYPKRQPLIPE